MKVAVIADADTLLAFHMAGLEGRVARLPTDVPALVEQLLREQTGLILITEALFDENSDLLERMLLAPEGPLILAIPAFAGPMPRKAATSGRIAALLRR